MKMPAMMSRGWAALLVVSGGVDAAVSAPAEPAAAPPVPPMDAPIPPVDPLLSPAPAVPSSPVPAPPVPSTSSRTSHHSHHLNHLAKRHHGHSHDPAFVLVERHNHLFPIMLKLYARGQLRPNATLLHFDAHADLGAPDMTPAFVEMLEALHRRGQNHHNSGHGRDGHAREGGASSHGQNGTAHDVAGHHVADHAQEVQVVHHDPEHPGSDAKIHEATESTAINDFIIPLGLAGLIRHVVWVVPPWEVKGNFHNVTVDILIGIQKEAGVEG